ncbi:Ig-like domain-containing protein [Aquabacterium sp.]|uniref:Ig-like domain-containing protein n=1 Tax=Aquabacterium sp. TaxID=1872578 RepID=UPI003783CF7F
MANYTGTANNDAWTVVNPGTFSLDGLGGTDTLYLGTSLRSSYSITRSADGAVHVDSISGASGALHATLFNMEKLVFNNRSDVLDLTTYFGDTTAPTLVSESPTNQAAAVPVDSNVVFNFSEPIARGNGTIVIRNDGGGAVASFDAASSSALSISGNVLTIDPSANLPAATHFTFEFASGAIKDLAGNAYAGGGVYGFTTAAATTQLTGTAGNDTLSPGTGNATIDGLAGIDTLVLGQSHSAYSLSKTATGYQLSATNGSATDQLVNVERLQFTDARLALDLDGHAGEVARLLGAVFGPAAVSNASYAGIGLQKLDGGMSYSALAELAMGVTGKTSHDDIVTLLWTHVVGSAPTAAQKAPFVAMLDQGTSVGALVTMAADTDLNAAQIDLVGLQQHGLGFA